MIGQASARGSLTAHSRHQLFKDCGLLSHKRHKLSVHITRLRLPALLLAPVTQEVEARRVIQAHMPGAFPSLR